MLKLTYFSTGASSDTSCRKIGLAKSSLRVFFLILFSLSTNSPQLFAGDHVPNKANQKNARSLAPEESATMAGRLANDLNCPTGCLVMMKNLECAAVAIKEAVMKLLKSRMLDGKPIQSRQLRKSPNMRATEEALKSRISDLPKELSVGQTDAILSTIFTGAWEHFSEDYCKNPDELRTPEQFLKHFTKKLKDSAASTLEGEADSLNELAIETIFHQGEFLGPLAFLSFKQTSIDTKIVKQGTKETLNRGLSTKAESLGSVISLLHVANHCVEAIGCGVLRLANDVHETTKAVFSALEENEAFKKRLLNIQDARKGLYAMQFGVRCDSEVTSWTSLSRSEQCATCCKRQDWDQAFPDRNKYSSEFQRQLVVNNEKICQARCNEKDGANQFLGILLDQETKKFFMDLGLDP